MDSLFDLIGVLSFISGVILILNGTYQKEYGKYGRAIARFYLVGSLFLIPRKMEYVVAGVFLIVFTDLLASILWWMGKKYRLQIEYNALAKTVRNLLGKLGSILSNPYIGFFVSDSEGNVEFANDRLLELLQIERPFNIFTFLDKKVVERINLGKDIFCMTTLSVGGNTIPVKLSVVRTENGHTTLTGSILEDVTMPYNH